MDTSAPERCGPDVLAGTSRRSYEPRSMASSVRGSSESLSTVFGNSKGRVGESSTALLLLLLIIGTYWILKPLKRGLIIGYFSERPFEFAGTVAWIALVGIGARVFRVKSAAAREPQPAQPAHTNAPIDAA